MIAGFWVFSILLLVLPAVAISEQERAALCALEPFGKIFGWSCSQTAKACNWKGVLCDKKNGSIIGLNISNEDAPPSSLPTEIGRLNNLQILHLNNVQLTGSIPTEIGLLSQLTSLQLNTNQLEGTIPTQFANLDNLGLLFLDENGLSGTLPTEIGDMERLLYIELMDNDLSGTLPTQLQNLKNLMILSLEENWFSGTIPTVYGLLEKLEEIHLYKNNLTGTVPSELGNLKNLGMLAIWRTHLTGTIPTELGKLSLLWHLDLDQNKLSGTIPTEIGNMDLELIALDQNHLSGTLPTQFGQLQWLDTLLLFQNDISGPVPTEIGLLQHLTWLDMRANKLSGLPDEIEACPKLTRLDLSFNSITGYFSINNNNALRRVDLSMNNLTEIQFNNNSKLERIQLQYNSIYWVDIANNPNLVHINLQANELDTFPSFLRNDENQPLTAVVLSSNKIAEELPAWYWNSKIQHLDLSRNLIYGNSPIISFFSDPLLYPNSSQECDPELIIPDPDKRSINMIGNKMNQTLLKIIELSRLNERFPAICRIPNADRRVWTNIFPQRCEEEGQYLTHDLQCSSCYSQWEDQPTKDIEQWDEILMNFNITEVQKTFLTCTRCHGGTRTRARTLDSNRECDNPGLPLEQFGLCEYPCKRTSILPVKEQLPALLHELHKSMDYWGDNVTEFIPLLIASVFPDQNITISIPSEQDEVQAGEMDIYFIKVHVANCHDQQTFDKILDIFLTVCSAILKEADFKTTGISPEFNEFFLELRKCPDGYFPSPDNLTKCDSCFSDWKVHTDQYADPDGWGKNLAPLNFPSELFERFRSESYGTCDNCDNGQRPEYRDIIKNTFCEKSNKQDMMKRTVSCGYPCKTKLLIDITFEHILEELNTRVNRQVPTSPTFLALLVSIMFPNVSIGIPLPHDSRKITSNSFYDFFMLDYEIKFNLTGCTSRQQYQNISETVRTICHALTPQSTFVIGHDFGQFNQITLSQHQIDIFRVATVSSIVGAVFITPFLVLFGILFRSIWRYFRSDLRSLPEEMAWSYLDYLKRPWEWERQGSDRSWFHFKDLESGTLEWNRVSRFFNDYLDGSMLKIESIKSIYNPNLIRAFLSTWNTRDSRRNRMFSIAFEDDGFVQQREDVSNHFRKRVKKMAWNAGNEGNWIVPVVHGTSLPNAMSICQRGFAALGNTDGGWYGKGIYFTTFAAYTVPYLQPQDEPVLIISWVLPGNFYPVVEAPEVLFGGAIRGGSSHYVVTGYDGKPSKIPIFDELVIANEFSISPAFILSISKRTINSLFKKYKHAEMKLEQQPINQTPREADEGDEDDPTQSQPKMMTPKKKEELVMGHHGGAPIGGKMRTKATTENQQMKRLYEALGSEQEMSHFIDVEESEMDESCSDYNATLKMTIN